MDASSSNRRKNKRNSKIQARELLERKSGDVPEPLKCVVCLEAERAIILLNCGHVCACVDCAEKLVINYNRCPVCRADIMGALPAYVS